MEHTQPKRVATRRPARRRRFLKRAAMAAGGVLVAVLMWIVLVPFPMALLAPEPITSTVIVDRKDRPLREMLSTHEGRLRWLPLTKVSPHLKAATVHAEDKRFYQHLGFDPIAIGRSVVYNVQRRRLVTGASTLSQQTVKRIMYADMPRTLSRKLMELVWAIRLERTLSKDAILEQYLNRVPYGNQLFGVEAAARMYFGKPAAQLSLAEAALLAGLPQAPSTLNPYRNLEGARRRQRQILNAMLERGAIEQSAHDRAVREPLVFRSRRGVVEAPHLTDRLMQTLRKRSERPAVVRTTLDLDLQHHVEGIVESWIARVEHRGVSQAAVVVLDTLSGEVLAWVGSRDY
ncbi:MAG: transglycosylase domain-containing protein, partial [Myxococcota bacterium]